MDVRVWSNEYIKRVWELLDSGVDINFQDNDGVTVLIAASQRRQTDIVRLLLERGANPNIRDNDGDTALSLASIEGHTDIVRLLLENEANVNSRGYDGDTALIRASDKGYVDIVKLLLDYGADPNIQSEQDGDTALILASTHPDTWHVYTDIVRLLLENGANPNIQTEWGQTALSGAKNWGHTDIVKLLERHIRSTKIQSRFRGRQTRRKARTQKASQQLQASRLPVDYELSRRIGERLSRMSYNPEVAARIKEEDKNERIADYLKTLAQYGGKKKRRKTKKKRRKKSKKKKK